MGGTVSLPKKYVASMGRYDEGMSTDDCANKAIAAHIMSVDKIRIYSIH